ncbi:hypothetical protein P3T27_003062 [Kitasatospora sp. MAA19]|uniref:hypothetical protein n=1 Tax=unclassified Kitasatospora TaxID=2633591 RepID=UPI002475B090|nr:hypothetical protein [Kitasatospora sp. MAA19]MDH6706339.1 hypothetical protein [Kitasatospora sp. MAA19]
MSDVAEYLMLYVENGTVVAHDADLRPHAFTLPPGDLGATIARADATGCTQLLLTVSASTVVSCREV